MANKVPDKLELFVSQKVVTSHKPTLALAYTSNGLYLVTFGVEKEWNTRGIEWWHANLDLGTNGGSDREPSPDHMNEQRDYPMELVLNTIPGTYEWKYAYTTSTGELYCRTCQLDLEKRDDYWRPENRADARFLFRHDKSWDEKVDSPKSPAISPDGRLVAYTKNGGNVVIRDGEKSFDWPFPSDAVLKFSPESKILVGAAEDGSVGVWDSVSQQGHILVKGEKPGRMIVSFSPDNKSLVCISLDGNSSLFSLGDWKLSSQYHLGEAFEIVEASSGSSDLSAGVSKDFGHVTVWNSVTGEKVTTIKLTNNAKGSITSIAFSPGGRRLAITNKDSAAQIYDVASGEQIQVLGDSTHPIQKVLFAPHGMQIATLSQDKEITFWELPQTPSQRLSRDIAEVYPLCVDPPEPDFIQALRDADPTQFTNPPQFGHDAIRRVRRQLLSDKFFFAVFWHFTGEKDPAVIQRYLLQYSYIGIALLAYAPTTDMEAKIERAIMPTGYGGYLAGYRERHDREEEEEDREREYRYGRSNDTEDGWAPDSYWGGELQIYFGRELAYEIQYKGDAFKKAQKVLKIYGQGSANLNLPPPDPLTSPIAKTGEIVDLTFQKVHELSRYMMHTHVTKPLGKRLSHLAEEHEAKERWEARKTITQNDKFAKQAWIEMEKDVPLDPLNPDSEYVTVIEDRYDYTNYTDFDYEHIQKFSPVYTWPEGAREYIKKLNKEAKEDPIEEKAAMDEYYYIMKEYADEDLDVDHILNAIKGVKEKYNLE